MGRRCRAVAIARATRRAKRSSPKSRISSASSGFGQARDEIRGALLLRRSFACRAARPSGTRNPRSGVSSCVEETPRSRAIPAIGSVLTGASKLHHIAEPSFENLQASVVALGQVAAAPHRLADRGRCRRRGNARRRATPRCSRRRQRSRRHKRRRHAAPTRRARRREERECAAIAAARTAGSAGSAVIRGAARRGRPAAATAFLAGARARASSPDGRRSGSAPRSESSSPNRQTPRCR